jgi:glycosyltransferase involved in cell wall biosynthesis
MIFLVSPNAHYPSHNWPNTVALMRALRRKGQPVQAVIFSTGTEPAPLELRASVTSVFLALPWAWRRAGAGQWQNRRFGGLMMAFETMSCLFKAVHIARKEPEPVLHFIGGSYWLVVLATFWFRRCRFVYSLYGSMLSGPASGFKAWTRQQLKKLLRHATATGRLDFTCENECLQENNSALVGTHVRLIPYAIDDEERLPPRAEARQRLDLPAEERIILFFGTHRREKDYATALKGCLRLAVPPLALFVGKVISENDPRRVAAACHYPNARILDEFVPEEMVKYFFAAADAVALPYEAGFSKGSGVLIECCRHLRPMIVSATPYFSVFVKRYACGVTYAPLDEVSFANAAHNVLSDNAKYRAALEQARHDHSWNSAADKYLELYADQRRENFGIGEKNG